MAELGRADEENRVRFDDELQSCLGRFLVGKRIQQERWYGDEFSGHAVYNWMRGRQRCGKGWKVK